ncbi:citrate lyase holo-[acyl-carrier protein] synthase [Deferribacter autotrophicus]|nr:citrate lyase holo-[acyl-carrier protein] synthase [Deferribacter autotrophicus]
MSLEKLRNDLLLDREKREEKICELLQRVKIPVVFFSLNIPGENKALPGTKELASFGIKLICTKVKDVQLIEDGVDTLGHYALFIVNGDVCHIKRKMVEIEEMFDFCRLFDIDVYDVSARQIKRKDLGLSERKCLICDKLAYECITERKHREDELVKRVFEIIENFLSKKSSLLS